MKKCKHKKKKMEKNENFPISCCLRLKCNLSHIVAYNIGLAVQLPSLNVSPPVRKDGTSM